MRIRLQRRQLIPRLRAIPDGQGDDWVEPRPPRLADDPARFRVSRRGQDPRPTIERCPPRPENRVDFGALPVKLCATLSPGRHDREIS